MAELDPELLSEMRATHRRAGRVIAAARKAGKSVDGLVARRDALGQALAAHEPNGRVEVRRARSTGTVVGLYRNTEDSGFESDPETPWSVVCEDHGGIVCTESRASGRTAMSCPNDWCPGCRGEE